MMQIIRFAVLIVAIMSLLYPVIAIFSRSLALEALERKWEASHPGVVGVERDNFLAEGMAAYRKSLRRRIVPFAALLPAVAVAAIAYLVNHT
ncbi:hypothetical protein [Defluviimonas salinarum]|uniref:ABC transporter permease n=1 Tax=Defluviimonas salinarum TaxID=2992147 RepID=A0ABT3J5I7_9RHOB|nr:hypothetical protein [Defluviimonas salinarum]MCW3782957.1 hypothetical protein [Defluviimonas salinarum]